MGEIVRVITLYTKDNCPACMMTKKLLKQYGLNYMEINAPQVGGVVMDKLRAKGYRSFPVVEVKNDNGEWDEWSGFRPDKLKGLAGK